MKTTNDKLQIEIIKFLEVKKYNTIFYNNIKKILQYKTIEDIKITINCIDIQNIEFYKDKIVIYNNNLKNTDFFCKYIISNEDFIKYFSIEIIEDFTNGPYKIVRDKHKLKL